MPKLEQEKPFAIQPGRPKIQYDKYGHMPKPLRVIMRKADRIGKRSRKNARRAERIERGGPGYKIFVPPCIIRAMSAPSEQGRGAWRAIGKYLAVNKPQQEKPWDVFDTVGRVSDPRRIAGLWHEAGDSKIYKMVISLKDGAGVNLKILTRDLMAGLNEDLNGSPFKAAGSGVPHGARIEWMAAAHYDTDNHHAHVVLRASAGGKEFHLTTPMEMNLRRIADASIERQLRREKHFEIQRDKTQQRARA